MQAPGNANAPARNPTWSARGLGAKAGCGRPMWRRNRVAFSAGKGFPVPMWLRLVVVLLALACLGVQEPHLLQESRQQQKQRWQSPTPSLQMEWPENLGWKKLSSMKSLVSTGVKSKHASGASSNQSPKQPSQRSRRHHPCATAALKQSWRSRTQRLAGPTGKSRSYRRNSKQREPSSANKGQARNAPRESRQRSREHARRNRA